MRNVRTAILAGAAAIAVAGLGGVASRHFIGVDKLMWSSDYPHQASTWPHSQEVVARDFKDASAEDKFKITRGNAARLYGFDA